MHKSKFLSCAAVLLVLSNGPFVAVAQGAAKPAAARSGATKPAAGAQTNAKQLLANARSAVAGIYKAAKASKGTLDPKNKKQAPFWQAVTQMQSTLGTIGRQVTAKDRRLAATLSKGTETLAKLKTTWPRLGVTNAKVSSYLAKLDNAYTALRSARGAEGARARKAGPLTAQERERFQKIQQSQGQLAQRLGAMQAKARQKKDRGTEASLTRLIEQSNRIAKAQLTVDAFLLAVVLLDQIQGEWEAYSYYVGPEYRDSWVEIDVWVETSFTSYDSWYVESFESYSVEASSTWETSFEVEADFDFEVTDVSLAEVDSLETELDASFTYDELGWEAYAEENVTAEMEETVYEEAEDNLDVAAEAWEEEGLEVEAGDELMDEEDQAELDEEEDEEAADDEDEAGDDEEDAGDDEDEAGDDEEDAGDDEDESGDDEEDAGDYEDGGDEEDGGDDEDAGDDEDGGDVA
ncbi:MAG TPA: hypothetical protein VF017_09380 [Thermoanaerobaculia bacterium]|nr:hypothetical protein [Thermoanaerobaculia bacterium]